MSYDNWSKSEKEVARKVFNMAKKRAYDNLINTINSKKIQSSDDIWSLRDLLNEKAIEFDNIFDYRYSQLVILFVRYVQDGLLDIEELTGLSEDKISVIKNMTDRDL